MTSIAVRDLPQRIVDRLYERPARVVIFTFIAVGIGLMAAGGALYHTITSSRQDVRQNSSQIVNQQEALVYLCETVSILNAVIVQTAAIDRKFVGDTSLSPTVRQTIRQRLRVLDTAHQELSDTRACRQIE